VEDDEPVPELPAGGETSSPGGAPGVAASPDADREAPVDPPSFAEPATVPAPPETAPVPDSDEPLDPALLAASLAPPDTSAVQPVRDFSGRDSESDAHPLRKQARSNPDATPIRGQ
jgi:hypothetical protein